MRWIFKVFYAVLFAIFINSAFAEITTYKKSGWLEYKLRVRTLMERIAKVVDALILHTNDPDEKQRLFVEWSKAITNIVTIRNEIFKLKNQGDMEF